MKVTRGFSLTRHSPCIPTKPIEFLQLEENRLHGEIPRELGHLSNLVELKLHKNDLTGPLPLEICDQKESSSLVTYVTADCGGLEPSVSCSYPECCSECHFY
jgi:hypothetical protein